MNSNKVLHITNCYFNLPDDFSGTLGEALMLMANRAIQAEAYKEVRDGRHYDSNEYLERLIENDKSKCILKYEVIELEVVGDD